MPLYEYECQKCGHRFERIRKFSDVPVKKCPECGGKVEQLLSAPAVQFKGSGWYVTDYARKGAGGKSGESGDSAGPKSNVEASSDGKPAATESKGGSADKSGSKPESKSKSEPSAKEPSSVSSKRGRSRR